LGKKALAERNMDWKKALIYLVFVVPQVIWLSLILAAPLLACSGHADAAGVLHFLFHPTCHQLPERSFYVFGCVMPVCARCFAIYAGFLASTLLYPLFYPVDNMRMPDKRLLIAALIPIAVDGGLQLVSSYESTNLLRLITGLICGGATAFYLLPAYNEIIRLFMQQTDNIIPPKRGG
jgi:uncharacterized membrane protein